jgi:hypothetical protein
MLGTMFQIKEVTCGIADPSIDAIAKNRTTAQSSVL